MEANFGRRSFESGGVGSICLAEGFENVQCIARGGKPLPLLKDVDEDGAKAIEPSRIGMSAFEHSCMKCIAPQTNLFQCLGANGAVRPKRSKQFGYGGAGPGPGSNHFS